MTNFKELLKIICLLWSKRYDSEIGINFNESVEFVEELAIAIHDDLLDRRLSIEELKYFEQNPEKIEVTFEGITFSVESFDQLCLFPLKLQKAIFNLN